MMFNKLKQRKDFLMNDKSLQRKDFLMNDKSLQSIGLKLLIVCIIGLLFCLILEGIYLKYDREIYELRLENSKKDIQINSLWMNVQQLQDEYSKVVDILYNPENEKYLGF